MKRSEFYKPARGVMDLADLAQSLYITSIARYSENHPSSMLKAIPQTSTYVAYSQDMTSLCKSVQPIVPDRQPHVICL